MQSVKLLQKKLKIVKMHEDLYKDDAVIQKVLATLFTVAYFGHYLRNV